MSYMRHSSAIQATDQVHIPRSQLPVLRVPNNTRRFRDLSPTNSNSIPELVEHYRLPARRDGDNTIISVPDRGRPRFNKDEVWGRVKDLGQGSFGVVRLEKRMNKDKDEACQLRAVKQVLRGVHAENPFQESCQRELYALAKLSRPQYSNFFARFHGWFEDGKSIFLSMEYFRHGDLGRYVEQPMPEAEAKEITSQLLCGLEIIHRYDITHRDLKPQNIFVVRRLPVWWVKIGDFGICKRIEDDSTYLHTFVGTRLFMAPEIETDNDTGRYTSAVDLWSLGCVVFQLLTAQLPFRSPADIKQYKSANKKPQRLLDGKDCSLAAVHFVVNLLASDAAKRPSASGAKNLPWIAEHLSQEEIDDKTTIRSNGSVSDLSSNEELSIDHTLEQTSWTNPSAEPPSSRDDTARPQSFQDRGNAVPNQIILAQEIPIIKLPVKETLAVNVPSSSTERARSQSSSVHVRQSPQDSSHINLSTHLQLPTVTNFKDDLNQAQVLRKSTSAVLLSSASVDNPSDRLTQLGRWSQDLLAELEAVAALNREHGFDLYNTSNFELGNKGSDKSLADQLLLRLAREGNTQTASLLFGGVAHRAHIDVTDVDGNTPLRLAIRSGHRDFTLMLTKHGANRNKVNPDGTTYLHDAAHGAHDMITSDLLKLGCYVSPQHDLYGTPLHIAASRGFTNVVRTLLEFDAEPSAVRTCDGRTPLMDATSESHTEIAELLIDADADASIESKDCDGRTALHIACMEGHVSMVNILLSCGARIEARNNLGNTALHFAAMNGYGEIVDILIERGANITAVNYLYKQAIHIAKDQGHIELTYKILMFSWQRAPTDPYTRGQHSALATQESTPSTGCPPPSASEGHRRKSIYIPSSNSGLEYASRTEAGHSIIPSWTEWTTDEDELRKAHDRLRRRNLNLGDFNTLGTRRLTYLPSKWLMQLAAEGDYAALELLLRGRANVDAVNENGSTPLAIAVEQVRPRAVAVLVKYGADIMTKDSSGAPLLTLAIRRHLTSIVDILLTRLPDRSIRNRDGQTLLHIAVQERKAEIIELLLQKGISPGWADFSGDTPLHVAARMRNPECARLLISYRADINHKNKAGLTPYRIATLRNSWLSDGPQDGMTDEQVMYGRSSG